VWCSRWLIAAHRSCAPCRSLARKSTRCRYKASSQHNPVPKPGGPTWPPSRTLVADVAYVGATLWARKSAWRCRSRGSTVKSGIDGSWTARGRTATETIRAGREHGTGVPGGRAAGRALPPPGPLAHGSPCCAIPLPADHRWRHVDVAAPHVLILGEPGGPLALLFLVTLHRGAGAASATGATQAGTARARIAATKGTCTTRVTGTHYTGARTDAARPSTGSSGSTAHGTGVEPVTEASAPDTAGAQATAASQGGAGAVRVGAAQATSAPRTGQRAASGATATSGVGVSAPMAGAAAARGVTATGDVAGAAAAPSAGQVAGAAGSWQVSSAGAGQVPHAHVATHAAGWVGGEFAALPRLPLDVLRLHLGRQDADHLVVSVHQPDQV